MNDKWIKPIGIALVVLGSIMILGSYVYLNWTDWDYYRHSGSMWALIQLVKFAYWFFVALLVGVILWFRGK